MCHFELTAKELGIDGKWQISDPGSISTPQELVRHVKVRVSRGS